MTQLGAQVNHFVSSLEVGLQVPQGAFQKNGFKVMETSSEVKQVAEIKLLKILGFGLLAFFS